MTAPTVEPQASASDSLQTSPSSGGFSSVVKSAASNLVGRAVSRPLLPLALGLAGGIVAGIDFNMSIYLTVGVLLAAIALFWTKEVVAFTFCALVSIGLSLGLFRMQEIKATTIPLPPSDRLYDVEGVVASEPNVRQHSVNFLVDVISVDDGRHKRDLSQRWDVYATGASADGARSVKQGDTVRLSELVSALATTGATSTWQQRSINQGINAEVTVRRHGGVAVLSRSSGSWFQRLASHERRISEQALSTSLTPTDAALVSAIFFGDKNNLGPDIQSAFQATGTVHLLATAGLHIGILVLIFKFIGERLTIPRKWMALSGIVCVWLYALMAGGRPAVTRAAFVASIYFAAIVLERIPDLLSALSLCAIVLLWVSPRELQDAGFQFTFLTVLGITAIMPALDDVWTPLIGKLRKTWPGRALKHFVEVENLSLAAQASSAPLVAVYFNLVTIYGLAANLLAVPLMFLLLPMTVLVIGLGSIWKLGGALTGHLLLAPVLHLVIDVIGGIASLPHCAVSVESPSWSLVGVYYAALFGGSFIIHAIATQARSGDRRGGSASADEPAGVGVERALAG